MTDNNLVITDIYNLKMAVIKTSLQYRCTQNQFTVYVHTKPVCSTGIHKTSLQYMCTQNQVAVHVDTKPACSAGVHKNQFTVQAYTNQFTVQVYTNQFTVQVYTKSDTLFKFFFKGSSQVEKLAT